MKLALFDIDGTLTDTVGLCDELYAAAVAHVAGVASVELDWRLHPDATDSGAAAAHFHRATGRPAVEAELTAIRERFVADLRAAPVSARAVQGAYDVFERVAALDGWCAAIATGNWREAAVVKFGWAGLVMPDVPMGCADDSPARADILRAAVGRAAERAGVGQFERVVYFGDGLHDVRAAREVGIGFVAVTAVRAAAPLRAEGAREFLDHFRDETAFRVALERAPRPALSPDPPPDR